MKRKAAEILRELALQAPAGQAGSVFAIWDGFEMIAEDQAEWKRPLRTVAYFLFGRDGLIRWASVESRVVPLPTVEDLLSLI